MNKEVYLKEIADWDDNADFYSSDNFMPYQEKITRKIMYEYYNIKKSDKVLEVGGGIIKAEKNVVVLDFSSRTIEECKKVNGEEKCVLGSAHDIPFPDNHFDVIICNGVLHHLKVQEIFQDSLSEFYRVLKEKGKLCVFDRANNIAPRLFFKFRQPFKKIYKPKSTCSTTNEVDFLEEDVELIKRSGFKLIRRKFIVNIFYQFLVIFANMLHYIFGNKVSFYWQKITWPHALVIEKIFLFKSLCAEQIIVFRKK